MSTALHSYKVDKDGQIRVRHTFYAPDEVSAEVLMDEHGDGCDAYGPALDAGQTIEIYEEIGPGEIPNAALLRELADVEDDDPEDEEDDDEEDPEIDPDEEP
jgi:hypothetical protein